MALRGTRNYDRLMIQTFLILANITAWTPVKFAVSGTVDDDHVVACDSNDPLMIGWAHYDITKITGTPGAPTELEIQVVLNGMGIIPVTVASGQTATRGTPAVGVTGTGNYKNSPTPVAGGGTLNNVYGRFMQSGVAGDVVGLMVVGSGIYSVTA